LEEHMSSKQPLSTQKVWMWNGCVSLLLFLLLGIFADSSVKALGRFLMRMDRPMADLSYTLFDSLIIAFIPVWSCFSYYKDKGITWKRILKANLFTLLSVFFTCIAAFEFIAHCVKSASPWIPSYVVIIPFPFFWTMVLLIGVLIPLVIRRIIPFFHTSAN
ncbi:MAG TPA: hypothetical protein VNZ86_07110, partial [Bacteroidia bacterium]|nr:hypothetical protein [Bacteroidia bacterium]